MMIKIYTNQVFGGWSPEDYETGLGGSEEKLVEFARETAKQDDVIVYMNGVHGTFDGVEYRPHKDFQPWVKHDVFISFKSRGILDQTINADLKIHWTTEIEPPWKPYELASVDRISTISNYHKREMGFSSDRLHADYLWADLRDLAKHESKLEKGSMLYSSSFDRGLEELLTRWPEVKEKLGLRKLYITYGWEFIDRVIRVNPQMRQWKDKMEKLMDQEGVELLGKLTRKKMNRRYWKAEYWCLPLNNPQSELFCLNAIKAQYCGAIPVVRRIGALQETVNEFIDWDELMGERVAKSNFESLEANREFAKQFNMTDIIGKWHETLNLKN